MSERRFGAFLDKLNLNEIDSIRQWYDEYAVLEEIDQEKQEKKREAAEAKKEKKNAKQMEKEARLRGHAAASGGIGVFSQSNGVTPLQRKTIASVKSNPAVDAMVRESRKNFSEGGVKERLKSRRAGVDATAEAPMALLIRRGLKPKKGSSTIQEEEEEEEEEEDENESLFATGSGGAKKLKFKKPFKVPEFIDWIEANAHWKDYLESSHQGEAKAASDDERS